MADKIIKQNGVIWFDKTGLSIYLENKPFLRLNFTPDIFSNLEIIDKIKLENLIRAFIKQNSLTYLTFVLILTPDILFEKVWPINQTEVQKKEETDFIESIPFENTITHSWIKDNNKKVIATNNDYILTLKQVFQKDNGHLIGAYPYSMFGANVRNESVSNILKQVSSLKFDNLYDESKEPKIPKSPQEIEKAKNTDKSLMPVLIVIFVVLIGLLAFIMLRK